MYMGPVILQNCSLWLFVLVISSYAKFYVVTFCPICFVKMQNLNCDFLSDFLSCDFLSSPNQNGEYFTSLTTREMLIWPRYPDVRKREYENMILNKSMILHLYNYAKEKVLKWTPLCKMQLELKPEVNLFALAPG